MGWWHVLDLRLLAAINGRAGQACPTLFYMGAFLLTWQVGVFFGDIRHVLSVLASVVR